MSLIPIKPNLPATVAKRTVGAIFDAATTAAEIAIEAQLPFLGLPVLKQVWEALFGFIIGKLSEQLGDGAAFVVIDLETFSEVQGVIQSTKALQTAQLTGDPNAIAMARAASDAAAASLLTFDGAG